MLPQFFYPHADSRSAKFCCAWVHRSGMLTGDFVESPASCAGLVVLSAASSPAFSLFLKELVCRVFRPHVNRFLADPMPVSNNSPDSTVLICRVQADSTVENLHKMFGVENCYDGSH
ncbi:hypothetical protein HS088_TW15G01208 [Tripterygium wilfordii]|uniref:Uncharacterized protein n=1 Tax=Tripterygium wilfordii TaxID=458696 RepID=A0A7J7CNN3_TRIWF|nr:hypothetical protein HS088_TW15G01208 [Tripterygium wilfordii]